VAGPIVFISYADGDEGLRRALEDHLAPLKRDGHIHAWHSGLVEPGQERRRRIAEQLLSARIVVLLLSAAYLADDELYAEEATPALARAREGATLVIPVVVRPFNVQATPFAGLSLLPRNEVPVVSWSNPDEAWVDVAQGIRQAVTTLRGSDAPLPRTKAAPPSPRHEDEESRALTGRLEAARSRRRALEEIGASTAAVDAEILDLRRRLREGGLLRAGDALGDGRYRLIERIGRGGFATVWSAYDRERHTRVALKVLHSDLARDPHRRERFFRGAKVMARLGHEAVVRVLQESGQDGGFLFFVMELMTGGDLHHAVIKGEVASDRAVAIILGVGGALAEAHAKGIVHRDVKPANILLDEAKEPRLTDFDLVAAGDTTGGTRTGALGTFLYTAAEQMQNAKDADARADVYSLGMTAVFALHGRELPAIVTRRPEKVIEALACDRAVKDVLSRAIEFEPGDRFADAGAFCKALREATASDLFKGGADLDVFEALARKARPPEPPPEVDDSSERVRQLIRRIDDYRRAKDHDTAIAFLFEAVEQMPASRVLREKLCDVLIEAGEQAEAVRQMLALARLLASSADIEGAARILDEVLLLEPGQAEAIGMLRELGYTVQVEEPPPEHAGDEFDAALDDLLGSSKEP
jgi:serine/threonine protein kinase